MKSHTTLFDMSPLFVSNDYVICNMTHPNYNSPVQIIKCACVDI